MVSRANRIWLLALPLGFGAYWAWQYLYLGMLIHLSIPFALSARRLVEASYKAMVPLTQTYDYVVVFVCGAAAGAMLGVANRFASQAAFGFFVLGFALALFADSALLFSFSDFSLVLAWAPWNWGFVVSAYVGFLAVSKLRQRYHAA